MDKDRIARLFDEVRALEASQHERLLALTDRISDQVGAVEELRRLIAEKTREGDTLQAEYQRVKAGEDIKEKHAELDALLKAPALVPPALVPPALVFPGGIEAGCVHYPKHIRAAKYESLTIVKVEDRTFSRVRYHFSNGKTADEYLRNRTITEGHCRTKAAADACIREDYNEKCEKCDVRMFDIEVAIALAQSKLSSMRPQDVLKAIEAKGCFTNKIPKGAASHALHERGTYFKALGRAKYTLLPEGRKLAEEHLRHATTREEIDVEEGLPPAEPLPTGKSLTALAREWMGRLTSYDPNYLRTRMVPELVQTDNGPAVLLPSCHVPGLNWMALINDTRPEKDTRYIDTRSFSPVGVGDFWIKFVRPEEGVAFCGLIRDQPGSGQQGKDFEGYRALRDGQIVSLGLCEYGNMIRRINGDSRRPTIS
jgi:hypothetical protein